MLSSLKILCLCLLLSVCIPLNFGQAAEFYMQSDDRANDNHGSVDGSLDEDLDLLGDEEAEYDQCDYRIADPVKYWNLAIYHFNDKFYFWVLKPLVKGYIAVTPRIMRTGVQNFFINITTPIRLVNSLLQFKIKPVGTETIRFALNSTVGILGFWDPAEKYYGLKPKDEDLGQTFGFYGIGNGFYIVWPFLGSSSLRDSVGLLGDRFLNLVSYVKPWEVSIGITGYQIVNRTSFKIGDYEAVKEAAIDPYEALKDGYIQYRTKRINE